MPVLNKHNLNVCQATSKEESRFTLNGILVTPNETVATDGHKLVRVTTPKALKVEDFPQIPGQPAALDTWKPFVLPTPSCVAIAKTIPKKNTIPILANAAVVDVGEDFVTVLTTDLAQSNPHVAKKLTGNFPDFNRVIPKIEMENFFICLDAQYVRDLADMAMKFIDAPRSPALRFYFGKDGQQAVRMEAHNETTGQQMTAVLMPIRSLAKDGKREIYPELEALMKPAEPDPAPEEPDADLPIELGDPTLCFDVDSPTMAHLYKTVIGEERVARLAELGYCDSDGFLTELGLEVARLLQAGAPAEEVEEEDEPVPA